jgi:hypothetical protein
MDLAVSLEDSLKHACVSLFGLQTSGLFPLGRFFYSSLSWGSYRVHSFWSKFYPVYFNRDFAACLIFPPEYAKSELDLFEVPPTQSSVVCVYWKQKGLTSALTDQGPYELAVNGAWDDLPHASR